MVTRSEIKKGVSQTLKHGCQVCPFKTNFSIMPTYLISTYFLTLILPKCRTFTSEKHVVELLQLQKVWVSAPLTAKVQQNTIDTIAFNTSCNVWAIAEAMLSRNKWRGFRHSCNGAYPDAFCCLLSSWRDNMVAYQAVPSSLALSAACFIMAHRCFSFITILFFFFRYGVISARRASVLSFCDEGGLQKAVGMRIAGMVKTSPLFFSRAPLWLRLPD